MAQAEARGEYHVIVVASPAGKDEEAAGAFAKAFHLDPAAVSGILRGAPIVFASGLTKAEVRAVTPHLLEISKLGVEFRITMREPGEIARVAWPVRPQFPAAGAGSPAVVAFDWRHQAFLCPTCGETFRFTPLGKLPLTEPAAAKEVPMPARGAATPVPAAKTPVPKAPSPAPPSKSAAAPAGGESDLIPLEELGDLEAELESATGGGDPAAPAAERAPAGSGEGEAAGISAADVDSVLSGLDSGGGEGVGEIDLAALDLGVGDVATEGLISAVDEIKGDPGGTPTEGEAAAAAGGGAEDDGERYNVFITQIKDTSKRKEVAKIIAGIRNCSMGEAEQFTSRTMFKAADGVAKGVAEELLNKLKKLSIAARMTKVTK